MTEAQRQQLVRFSAFGVYKVGLL